MMGMREKRFLNEISVFFKEGGETEKEIISCQGKGFVILFAIVVRITIQ